MCNSSDHLEYLLFADDTNVFLSGNNITELYSTMNTEFEKLAEWFRANLLSHNTKKKTVYMLFHKARKKFVVDNCNIYISNSVISRVESYRFLGVIIVCKKNMLSWILHHSSEFLNRIIGQKIMKNFSSVESNLLSMMTISLLSLRSSMGKVRKDR